MVESIGICEKHALPLDLEGECELCRLSDMPSKAPPARSAWWAIVIPALILLGAAVWAYGSIGGAPGRRGVQPVPTLEEPTDAPTSAEPAQREPEPERVPPRVIAPNPDDIPTADDVPR